jgi:hypothetical protein
MTVSISDLEAVYSSFSVLSTNFVRPNEVINKQPPCTCRRSTTFRTHYILTVLHPQDSNLRFQSYGTSDSLLVQPGWSVPRLLVDLIARPASEVSKVSRREVPLVNNNPRFETLILKDFGTYDSNVLDKLKGASGAVWAQGISITQVPREYVCLQCHLPNI